MISEIRLGNVRLFRADSNGSPIPFALNNLTVLCGTNSAGKSTILKALLLLKQISVRGTSTGKPPFAGEFIDFGKYSTAVTKGHRSDGMCLGLTVRDRIPTDLAEMLLGRDYSGSGSTDYSLDCDIDIGFLGSSRGAAISPDDEEVGLVPDSQPAEPMTYLRRIRYVARIKNEHLLSWDIVANVRGSGEVYYTVALPKAFAREEVAAWGFRHPALGDFKKSESLTFECSIQGMSVSSMTVTRRSKSKKSSQIELRVPPPFAMLEMQQDLARNLRQVRHVAPLRAPAKRYYVASFDAVALDDPTGEQVPFVVRDRADHLVQHCDVAGVAREESLAQALDYWIHFLRTGVSDNRPKGRELTVSSREDVLVQLSIASVDGSGNYSLSDSGFGYSQVLPIIAKALLFKNAIFLIEQPELHLNPALQVRLAHFFATMASDSRQFIIETHSEHLVNMLRVLCAEDLSGTLPNRIKLYFLSTGGARTNTIDLSILPDGSVPDWPLEFFGESLQIGSRLMRAQSRNLRKPLTEDRSR